MEIKFRFINAKSLITYDLEDGDVSADDIAKQSNNLFTYITVKNNEYQLPFSTLRSNLSGDNAKAEFKRAFKATGSKSKISRLLVVEIDGKDAFIENL